MEVIPVFLSFIIGVVFGIGISFFLTKMQTRKEKELAEERKEIIENMKAIFGNLAFDALKNSNDQFFKVAKERFDSERMIHGQVLDSKKSLIDQQLHRMTTELENVSKIVNELEKDREKKFAELSKQLEFTCNQTANLIKSTNTLREALASSKSRGQWGERMAEDVLRIAGFIENVNYVKQKTVEESGERPDFTFLLPGNRSLNMDVKFPFDNYIRFIESESDSEREVYRKNFMKDVRNRVKEVTSRAYINPEQNTLNYVILFIPNEQIFAFIHEQDCSLVDEGLKQRVIICSPITLFAVLAVIRAAVDNFALEQTSNKIVALLGSVKTQLDKFIEGFINLGKKLDAARDEYDKLNTTRRRQLEKPMNEIEHIMKQRGIAADDTLEEDWLHLPENSEQNHESL